MFNLKISQKETGNNYKICIVILGIDLHKS